MLCWRDGALRAFFLKIYRYTALKAGVVALLIGEEKTTAMAMFQRACSRVGVNCRPLIGEEKQWQC